VISEATARALTMSADLTPLPPQRVKGRDTPVVAYKITNTARQAAAVPAHGGLAPIQAL